MESEWFICFIFTVEPFQTGFGVIKSKQVFTKIVSLEKMA